MVRDSAVNGGEFQSSAFSLDTALALGPVGIALLIEALGIIPAA